MLFTRTLYTVVLSTSLLVGCGSKKSDDGDTSAAATKEAKKTALGPAFFGSKPAPIGPLAKLAWGAPKSEVKKQMPELFDGDRSKLLPDSSVENVNYGVSFHNDTQKLDRLKVDLPATAKEHILAAWGPGKEAKDSIGRPRTYWFDPDTGWRAYVEPGFGDDLQLVISQYQPAAKLLGEGPDGLGFAPHPLVGATIEDLRTHYKDVLVEESDEEAAKRQAELSKFTGQDLEKELGKARASARLELPPAEWEEYGIPVNFHWSDDGKIETVYFELSFKAHPAAKDELRALFEKKWGAPKEGKRYGKTIWIYRESSPRVFVEEDTISHGWDVHVTSRSK
jgi:hypothetical protein